MQQRWEAVEELTARLESWRGLRLARVARQAVEIRLQSLQARSLSSEEPAMADRRVAALRGWIEQPLEIAAAGQVQPKACVSRGNKLPSTPRVSRPQWDRASSRNCGMTAVRSHGLPQAIPELWMPYGRNRRGLVPHRGQGTRHRL